MKVRVPKPCLTDRDVERELIRQFNEHKGEFYDIVERDVVSQVMATFFVVLNKEFGFGQKRLMKLKTSTETLFKIMRTSGFAGKNINTDDCIDYLESKLGIDFRIRKED